MSGSWAGDFEAFLSLLMEALVVSSETVGTVERIFCQVGDVVKKDQELLVIVELSGVRRDITARDNGKVLAVLVEINAAVLAG